MEDLEDFGKLELSDRLAHKSWKVRQHGYSELVELFKSPEQHTYFEQYQEKLKDIITDPNQISQETGINCVLEFSKSCSNYSSLLPTLVPLIVEKCLPSTRAGTRSNGLEVLLQFAETDTPDLVLELVFPGLDHKSPKNVASCINCIRSIVAKFGVPATNIKPIIKKIPKMFDHKDKIVRQEGTNLATELYRWVGSTLLNFLQDLKPVQIKELTALFENLPSQPTSNVQTMSKKETSAVPVETQKPESPVKQTVPVISEYDLADPVNVLNKIPKSFYADIMSTAWKVRKEASEQLLTILSHPKLEDGQYHELVNILAKKIADPNIVVAALAANCLQKLSSGLKKGFTQYKHIVLPPVLERMKEKKASLLEALKALLDSISSNLNSVAEIFDDLLEYFTHKNPNVRCEAIQWFTRCSTAKKDFPKSIIKQTCDVMFKCLDDSVDIVREAASESIAGLLNSTAEKNVIPYMEKLDKSKKSKILDYTKKRTNSAKAATPVNPPIPKSIPEEASKSATKATAKPKPSKAKPKDTLSAAKPQPTPTIEVTFRYSDDESQSKMEDLCGSEVFSKLSDSNWKIRLEGMNQIQSKVQEMKDVEAEVLVRALLVKTGWKETNFQVSSSMCSIFTWACSQSTFSPACGSLLISGLLNKLSDSKLKKVASECLDKISSKTSTNFVFREAYDTIKKQKSPKVIADNLLWINQCLADTECKGLTARELVDFLKTMLTNSNNSVRSNTITILTTLRRFFGPKIRDQLSDVSQSTLLIIDAEFAKVEKEPVNSSKKLLAINDDDSAPKIDLNNLISKQTMDDLCSSSWKERKAGLSSLAELLSGSPRILPILSSELMNQLKLRLSDSNKIVSSSCADVIGNLALAMGAPFEKYAKILLESISAQLSDQKIQNRTAALGALEKIFVVTNPAFMFTSISNSLNNENPLLRKELLKWTLEKLELITNNSDLVILIRPVLVCIQDRNNDVRKLSQSLLAELCDKVDCLQIESVAGDIYKGTALSTVRSAIDAAKSSKNVANAEITYSSKQESKDSSQENNVIPPKALKHQKSSGALLNSKTEQSSKEQTDGNEPVLISIDLKAKEARSNADKGINKWSFETPRKELIDLLASQFNGNINSTCVNLLFSEDHYKERDFLQGLKLIDDFLLDSGTIDANNLQQRCIANADLILKYLTIRFFDTNTTMLLKCLDLLDHYLPILDDGGYLLNEYEASCFLPFFIQKLGDPKESIRVRLRKILKRISRIYPVSKVFTHLLKGLNSKNVRTRVECLDELAFLVQRNGLTAFSPSKALPAIAAQISDRDGTVRNACLQVLVQSFNILGDECFKYLGKLSDKDNAIISERLKRLPVAESQIPPEKETSESVKSVQKPLLVKTPTSKIDMISISPSVPKEFSLDFEKIGLSTAPAAIATESIPTEHIAQPVEKTVVAPHSEITADDRLELMVDMIIARAENASEGEYIDSLKQIEKIIVSYPDKSVNRGDDILKILISGCPKAFGERFKDQYRTCKYLINLLILVFTKSEIASTISSDVLEKSMREVLRQLIDPKLATMEGSANISRLLNVLMVRIIENSNPNFCFKSLLCILGDCSSNTEYFGGKFSELVMKCLWKITKSIPNLIATGKLRPDDLLFDINEFFQYFPPQQWKKLAADSKNPQADMPLRTVKTILHEIVNSVGPTTINYAAILPHAQNHVIGYLRQMCLNNEKKKSGTIPEVPQSLHVPTDFEQKLDEIFLLISDKLQTKVGLQKLYQFQKSHPDAQLMVEQRITQAGSYFQGYIRRSLANIGREDLQKVNQLQNPKPIEKFQTPENDADSYKETLAKLQRMFVGKEKVQEERATIITEPPKAVPVAVAEPTEVKDSSANRSKAVADLKERLARMKKSINA